MYLRPRVGPSLITFSSVQNSFQQYSWNKINDNNDNGLKKAYSQGSFLEYVLYRNAYSMSPVLTELSGHCRDPHISDQGRSAPLKIW